jgi:hypothetical protein
MKGILLLLGITVLSICSVVYFSTKTAAPVATNTYQDVDDVLTVAKCKFVTFAGLFETCNTYLTC